MKLYFAGIGYNEILIKHKQKRLESFYYKKECFEWWDESDNEPIFLDSGAFSAMGNKSVINIQDYIDFIKTNKNRIEVYATLDVIGDPIATMENTKLMESQSLNPLPVFHFGSPKEILEKMIVEYDYIALGGLVPYAKQKEKMTRWLDFCFSIIRDNARVHGFGVNSIWAWERYPFYSVDATSWLSSPRYGISRFVKDKKVAFFENRSLHYKKRAENELMNYKKEGERVTELWEKRGIVYS